MCCPFKDWKLSKKIKFFSHIEGSNYMKVIQHFSMIASGLAMFLIFLAGLTSVLKITIPSLIFGFLLVPIFIILITCLHYNSKKEMKMFSMLGVIFACMYGVLISFNYYLQLTLMQKNVSGLELFSMSDPNSMMWVIEVLGYFFMGLSTIFVSIIFGSSFLERSIKLIFIVNGILGIGGIIGYTLGWNLSLMLWGLMLWNIIMPIAAGLLIYYFKVHFQIEA